MSAILQTLAAMGQRFQPSHISGLTGWWEAGDLATVFQDSGLTTAASSDNDPVGGWKDKSGNARHFLQSTSGARPLLKTGLLASRPVLRFDGSNDCLVGASSTALLSLAAGTVVAVASVTPNTSSSPEYNNSSLFGDNGGGYIGMHFNATGPTVTAFNYDGTSDFATRSMVASTLAIFVWRMDSTNLGIAVNNTTFTNAASGATASHTDNIALGRRYAGDVFLPCDIAELAMFNTAVNTPDLTNLITAWKVKYGIP